MRAVAGILIVAAHAALFGALAHRGVDLSVELPAGRVPDELAPRVEVHREGSPLVRTRWASAPNASAWATTSRMPIAVFTPPPSP